MIQTFHRLSCVNALGYLTSHASFHYLASNSSDIIRLAGWWLTTHFLNTVIFSSNEDVEVSQCSHHREYPKVHCMHASVGCTHYRLVSKYKYTFAVFQHAVQDTFKYFLSGWILSYFIYYNYIIFYFVYHSWDYSRILGAVTYNVFAIQTTADGSDYYFRDHFELQLYESTSCSAAAASLLLQHRPEAQCQTVKGFPRVSMYLIFAV